MRLFVDWPQLFRCVGVCSCATEFSKCVLYSMCLSFDFNRPFQTSNYRHIFDYYFVDQMYLCDEWIWKMQLKMAWSFTVHLLFYRQNPFEKQQVSNIHAVAFNYHHTHIQYCAYCMKKYLILWSKL